MSSATYPVRDLSPYLPFVIDDYVSTLAIHTYCILNESIIAWYVATPHLYPPNLLYSRTTLSGVSRNKCPM